MDCLSDSCLKLLVTICKFCNQTNAWQNVIFQGKMIYFITVWISSICLQEVVRFVKQQEKTEGKTYFADLKVKKKTL